MKRHLVLTGLPGSGKTTAGRLAAGRLGAAFTDIDETIELATGRTVAEVFALFGEPRFRELERSAVQGALDAPPHVVAPGAGWIAQPGNLEVALGAGALVVHLRVTPEAAAARLAGTADRPLLVGDPLAALQRLHDERDPWYSRAHHRLDASASAQEVAEALVALLAGAGTPP